MAGMRRVSDAWLAEQEMRAELEAEAWRLLRREMAAPSALPAPPPADNGPAYGGGAVLKALVRFMIAAAAAALAVIAGLDSGLGGFETWLAAGASFAAALALTAFEPLRSLVYVLSETARWALILGVVFGLAWLVLKPAGLA